MNASASLVSDHLAGEGEDEIVLDTLPGKFTVTRPDEALTPYGGLAAWSGFLKHLGVIERLADRCPVVRTSPNAAPVREVLHSFLLGALVEGKRFGPVRWVMGDPAVATLMGMERVRGEDALPRLARGWIGKVCARGRTVRKPNSTRRCRSVSLPTGIRQ